MVVVSKRSRWRRGRKVNHRVKGNSVVYFDVVDVHVSRLPLNNVPNSKQLFAVFSLLCFSFFGVFSPRK